MKKFRKGFTLLELITVIAIIGMLSSMMMVSNSEAQKSARATKIIEGFHSLSAAMMMLYNEDPISADKVTAPARIIDGAKKYIKNTNAFGDADKKQGTYYVTITNGTWWLSYQLAGATGAINDLLAKKADDFGLKAATNAKPNEAAAYAGAQQIFMNVR